MKDIEDTIEVEVDAVPKPIWNGYWPHLILATLTLWTALSAMEGNWPVALGAGTGLMWAGIALWLDRVAVKYLTLVVGMGTLIEKMVKEVERELDKEPNGEPDV